MIEVSIVIVCMNNLNNLYTCLKSINRYTKEVSYEIYVVAYLFSRANLLKAKKDFPWATFIESNEIRGFSENNNLALHQVKGKYCFVLNDDTEFKMPVLDMLVKTIRSLPDEVAVLSPRSVFGNGSFQSNGRIVHTPWIYILMSLHLYSEQKALKKLKEKRGVFETGDIVGAFFLIKTELFRRIGFFDEKYFFTPEDIAVSYELRKLGYKCYVDADVEIVHYEGMSGGNTVSMIKTATAPAAQKGCLMFYSRGNDLLYVLLSIISFITLIPSAFLHLAKGLLFERPNNDYVLALGNINEMKACFSRLSPKDLFIKYYNKIKK